MQTMKRAKILSASAGSGKTYQLALKYVCDVVRHPEKFRNILAVTFTNKATEEMKSRILREIDTLASGGRSSYVEPINRATGLDEATIRQRARRARTLMLHDYSRFSILTFDRFFQRILRAFIKELGIDLNYNIELDITTLLQRSADLLVESIAKDKALGKWLLEYAEERLNDGNRWDIRGELRTMGDEIFKERAARHLSEKVNREELREVVGHAMEHSATIKARIRSLGEEAVKYLAEYNIATSRFKGASRSFTSCFRLYAEGELKEPTATMLKAAESIDEWYGKSPDAEVVTAAEHLQPLLNEICTLYRDNIAAINTAAILRENYRSYALLGDLYDCVRDICDKEGIMVLSETKNILSTFVDESNAPFIYEKVGNRFEYFMIDEFQDTSLREWFNLCPLLHNAMASNPETSVFIVGDVKQSIYRWRGGDWRLLGHRAAEDLGTENCEVVSLKENFRSRRNIVEFNNRLIESVVEADNNYLNAQISDALSNNKIDETLHASLHDIIKGAYANHEQSLGHKDNDGGYAEVCLFDPKVIDSPFIEAIEDAINRGYRYSDILILVRGSNDGNKVADALFRYKEEAFTSKGKQGFNILTPDALAIENCEVVGFVIALLRLSINPRNDVERGLYNRYLGRDIAAPFNDEERALLRHIAHLSPAEAFDHIVERYRLNERKEHIAFLQAMHEQIISFSTTRIADIQHYLSWWDERGHKESIRVEMTDDTIEITTIHKSKGLEAPVVIIPYCKWELAPRANLRPVVWARAKEESKEAASIGAFPVIYDKTMEQSAFTAEYYNELVMSHVDGVNLLYVAATRASSELYMFVPYGLNTKSRDESIISNTARLVAGAVREIVPEGEELMVEGERACIYYAYGACESGEGIRHKRVGEDNNVLLNDYLSHKPSIDVRFPSRRFIEERMPMSGSARAYGIKLHRIFERAKSLEELHAALRMLELECSIDRQELLSLRDDIERAMQNERVREWFSGEWDEVKCEAELLCGSEVRRPDRVMIRGRRAVVVDYKFGGREDDRYRRQVAEYVAMLSKMGLYEQVEGYIWYIALGEVIEV